MNTVKAYILTGDGNVRSAQLVQQILDLGLEPIVIHGTSVKNAEIVPVFSQILNRFLLPGEVGAVITHHKGHQLGFEFSDTGIFFEDDAVISQDLNAQVLNELLDIVGEFKKPTIISLFGPEWNVLSRNKSMTLQCGLALHKAWFPPAGAVAYIANLRALQLASQSALEFSLPADWPAWSHKCEFYVSMPPCVQHSGLSLIEGSRENSQITLIQALKLLSSSSLSNFVRFRIKKAIFWRLAGIHITSASRGSSLSRFFL